MTTGCPAAATPLNADHDQHCAAEAASERPRDRAARKKKTAATA